MKLSEKAHAAQYLTDGSQLGLLEYVAESEKEREGPAGRSPHSRQWGIRASGWFFSLSQEGFSAPASGGSGRVRVSLKSGLKPARHLETKSLT